MFPIVLYCRFLFYPKKICIQTSVFAFLHFVLENGNYHACSKNFSPGVKILLTWLKFSTQGLSLTKDWNFSPANSNLAEISAPGLNSFFMQLKICYVVTYLILKKGLLPKVSRAEFNHGLKKLYLVGLRLVGGFKPKMSGITNTKKPVNY